MERTSTVRVKGSKALPGRSSPSQSLRSGVKAWWGRIWFIMLGRSHQYFQKVLDHSCRPPRDIPSELLQYGSRSLPSPIADCVGDFGTGTRYPRRHAMEGAISDQPTDIGSYPVSAGLDKEIIVELVDIFLDHRGLLGQHPHELPQLLARFGVPDTIDRRQQSVELLPLQAHVNSSRPSRGLGSSVRISAGDRAPVGSSVGRRASKRS